jgi:hypothetical protein
MEQTIPIQSGKLNVKDGLYYKKITDGSISVDGRLFRVPPSQTYVFVEVEGGKEESEVWLTHASTGKRLCRLVPEDTKGRSTAQWRI